VKTSKSVEIEILMRDIIELQGETLILKRSQIRKVDVRKV